MKWLFVIALLIASAIAARAVVPPFDDFSSSTFTSANWSTASFTQVSTGTYSFAPNAGQIDVTASNVAAYSGSGLPPQGTGLMTLQSYYAPISPTASWSVWADVGNTYSAASSTVQLGLYLSSNANASDNAKIVLLSTSTSTPNVHTSAVTGGTPQTSLVAGAQSGTVYLSYDGTTSTLTASFPATSVSQNYSLSGWSATTGATVSMYTKVVNSDLSNPLNLSAGFAHLDNFGFSGLTASPIPEPGTWAALAAAAALGVAVWRRRARHA